MAAKWWPKSTRRSVTSKSRAVLQPLGRRGPRVVDLQHLVGDEAGVEAVGDRVRRQRGEQDPQRGDVLAAGQGQHRPADGADEGDRRPRSPSTSGSSGRLAAGGCGRAVDGVRGHRTPRASEQVPRGPAPCRTIPTRGSRDATRPMDVSQTAVEASCGPRAPRRAASGRSTSRPSSGSTARKASAPPRPSTPAEPGHHGRADAAADQEEQGGDAERDPAYVGLHGVADRGAERGLADAEGEGHQHDRDHQDRRGDQVRAERGDGERHRGDQGRRRPASGRSRSGSASGRRPGARPAPPGRWAPSRGRPATPPSRG